MGCIKTITFLGPLEWRNLFGPKSKVSIHKKLVFKSGVGFLILFVLTDAILLRLDLQKKDNVQIQFFNFLHICLTYSNQISKNWKHVFHLKYVTNFSQCDICRQLKWNQYNFSLQYWSLTISYYMFEFRGFPS